MELNNTYLGFTDNMKPMEKARVEKLLNGKKRYNGVVLTNKQFIVNQIIEGSIPDIEENASHYSRKLGGNTQLKTEYHLKEERDNPTSSYWVIEKTLYNFAVYLIAKDFVNEVNIEVFIKDEQLRKDVKQQRIEREELAQKQLKRDQEEKKKEFQSWVIEQVDNYNDSNKIMLAHDIFMDEVGHFANHMIKLLVYIDNIDNSMCRESLKSWLHTGNKTSKKVFYHITGIKLPVTNKGTYEILNNITKLQYKGIVSYKKRQAYDKYIQTFYRNIRVPVPYFEEVQAEAYNKYGLNFFITNFEDRWQISEARSGLLVARGITKKIAFDELKKMIDRHGVEKFNEQIEQAIKRYGESPKCKQEVMA